MVKRARLCYKWRVQIKVALVEDDALVREELAKLINRAPGFACVGAYPDGETALAEAPGQKPDVVLMDINLPGMSGIECIRALEGLVSGGACYNVDSV